MNSTTCPSSIDYSAYTDDELQALWDEATRHLSRERAQAMLDGVGDGVKANAVRQIHAHIEQRSEVKHYHH